MGLDEIKTCLVITYGPVPTPQYQKVEGGGMRAWGLAKGLHAEGIKTTVTVNASFPQEFTEHEDIRLTNWSLDQQFIDLINAYDAVIVSYCMGETSVFVADHITPDRLLILDAYVPIYVEVSARDSADIDTEYRNYMQEIKRYNHVLKRGDYFLCANNAQKVFYTGVLSGLGIVNPRSYRQSRILIVPFGIHEDSIESSYNPYESLGIKKTDFVVLWFGGLYPWFRIEELLEAILNLSSNKTIKFVIVGGKNPFNSNPDFIRQYDKAYAFAKNQKLLEKTLYFVDWVDFDDRVNWYVHSDVVISINQPGEENKLSWRTRVMDYIWGELAIISNGGDPLSDELLSNKAAIGLKELSAPEISKAILGAFTDKKKLKSIRAAISVIKSHYFWPNLVEPIVAAINNDHRPHQNEAAYRSKLRIDEQPTRPVSLPRRQLQRAKRLAQLPRRASTHARRKGLQNTVVLSKKILRQKLLANKTNRPARYIFISHPINSSGAPIVLLDILEEFVSIYGAKDILLVCPYIEAPQLRRVRELGVKIAICTGEASARDISLQLDLGKNDFVLMNTVAVFGNYRSFIFNALSTGQLKKAYWFIHEDIAQVPGVSPDLMSGNTNLYVSKLLKERQLQILVPTIQTKNDFDKLFRTKHVQVAHLRLSVPKQYKLVRTADDFKTINFLISGTPADGRKGQLLAITALHLYLTNYFQKNPAKYRDFKLHLVTIGHDYVSDQIRWIGSSLLGSKLVVHPPVTRDKALKIYSECNAVICCSLNETFGLYVAEGMFMGHVVLRNDSAGMKEQVRDGVNGYYIDSRDPKSFAKTLEKVLNKKNLSNESLKKMSDHSRNLISPYENNSYLRYFNLGS